MLDDARAPCLSPVDHRGIRLIHSANATLRWAPPDSELIIPFYLSLVNKQVRLLLLFDYVWSSWCCPFGNYPIGASGNSAWCPTKAEANPSTITSIERGLHLSHSRWFYRNLPYPYWAPADNIPAERTSGGHRRNPFGVIGEKLQLGDERRLLV
jgi:hypothetical protein